MDGRAKPLIESLVRDCVKLLKSGSRMALSIEANREGWSAKPFSLFRLLTWRNPRPSAKINVPIKDLQTGSVKGQTTNEVEGWTQLGRGGGGAVEEWKCKSGSRKNMFNRPVKNIVTWTKDKISYCDEKMYQTSSDKCQATLRFSRYLSLSILTCLHAKSAYLLV